MKRLLAYLISALLLLAPTALAAETEEELIVDLDISVMSGTMVYSQVYNIMAQPEEYIGMVIKIAGLYEAYADTERDVVYHICLIPDATACCAQGMEFVWKGEHKWPDDYPKYGDEITVTGRLESYLED